MFPENNDQFELLCFSFWYIHACTHACIHNTHTHTHTDTHTPHSSDEALLPSTIAKFILSKLCLHYSNTATNWLLLIEAKFSDSSSSVLGKGWKFSSAANISYLVCLPWASEPHLWCHIPESLRKMLFEDQGRACHFRGWWIIELTHSVALRTETNPSTSTFSS